ncbi:DUF2141 domain-containing protein [Sphingomonadales bacterium 56]|uniref:DUF2141 domain-containing protein n=1 Tax=Sphingomonadales TaxID=204457 RepID=UPI000BE4273D|nr:MULTISPECIES: DUF2141 domain-containing protein [Sphingomonadaceae]MBY2928674.1 DUF2141 domain-containing protein [Sphingomonadales bacterium 56]MBY2959478.1 DUF2141 domain-containing protein [Sphingomonadales bacterium 58]CAD7337793.1 hypothetical protein SPHS6_01678 [Sphingobium sp. S6]CAD7339065.1 hypothetical protein SPHS8_02434 [Sphingobium sp. S8]
MRGKLLLLAGALMAGSGAAPAPEAQPLSIGVQGLRSMKGDLLICVARSAAYFPDCSKDPQKRHLVVPATNAAIPLGDMAPGTYAIAIIHDENGNGKLDTFAGIPREGVGFSRNPAIRFGAPSFRSAQFAMTGSAVRQDVKIKYFL